MNWQCLLNVIRCLEIGEKWYNLIQSILISTKISVLVNGSPTDEFTPCRGLRQGDMLAPYLILLIGEILNRLLKKAHDIGIIEGLQVPFHVDPIILF